MKVFIRTILTFTLITILITNCFSQSEITVIACGQIPTKPYLAEIAQLGFCQMQENRKLNSVSGESHYYFCDSAYFKVYSLTKLKDKVLLEITKNTGTGGYHYYFLNVSDNQNLIKVGFFQGYLDSIICKANNSVLFTVWIENYNYTAEYVLVNKSYKFKKIIRIRDNKGHHIPSDLFERLKSENGKLERWEL